MKLTELDLDNLISNLEKTTGLSSQPRFKVGRDILGSRIKSQVNARLTVEDNGWIRLERRSPLGEWTVIRSTKLSGEWSINSAKAYNEAQDQFERLSDLYDGLTRRNQDIR